MMEAIKNNTHTPGPWRARLNSINFVDGVYYREANGVYATRKETWIADLNCGTEGAEREANARLIAAAPELLEALERCIAALDLDDKFGDDLDARHEAEADACRAAVQAIRKARGE